MRKIALLLCMLLPLITYAQHFSISGTVVDKSTGEPVIGAGVLQSRPVTNLGQALQGAVPGLNLKGHNMNVMAGINIEDYNDRYMGISRPDFITVNVPEIGAATGEDKIEYASMFNVTDLSSSTEVLLWRQYSNSSSNNSTHYTVDYLQRNGSGSLKETGDATPAEPLWTIPCTTSGVKGSSSSLQKGSGLTTPSL